MPCPCSRRSPVFGPGYGAVRPSPGAAANKFRVAPWGSRSSVRLPSVRLSQDIVARRSGTVYPGQRRMPGSYISCAPPRRLEPFECCLQHRHGSAGFAQHSHSHSIRPAPCSAPCYDKISNVAILLMDMSFPYSDNTDGDDTDY